jgi:hypothetical protein
MRKEFPGRIPRKTIPCKGNHSCSHGKECVRVQVAAEQPPGVEGVLALLSMHDRSTREAVFATSLHRCGICFDEYPGADGIKTPCGHWHCIDCMREMAVSNLKACNPTAVRCPQPECRAELGPETLQKLLDAEQMARWDSLVLQRALAKMPDVVFCPRCEVPAVEHAEWAMVRPPECCSAALDSSSMPSFREAR